MRFYEVVTPSSVIATFETSGFYNTKGAVRPTNEMIERAMNELTLPHNVSVKQLTQPNDTIWTETGTSFPVATKVIPLGKGIDPVNVIQQMINNAAKSGKKHFYCPYWLFFSDESGMWYTRSAWIVTER